VLEAICGKVKAAVSVDTFYPVCAEAALRAGADIINDVSGVFNPDMAKLAVKYGAGYIVMHNPCGSANTAEYENGVVSDVVEFFDDMKTKAVAFGINEDSLCFDCGIRFG
jgi:dihydropteroate synthase